MMHCPRSINPDTWNPVISGDEITEEECNIIAAWIRDSITGEERPDLIAVLETAADFFDRSTDHLTKESLMELVVSNSEKVIA